MVLGLLGGGLRARERGPGQNGARPLQVGSWPGPVHTEPYTSLSASSQDVMTSSHQQPSISARVAPPWSSPYRSIAKVGVDEVVVQDLAAEARFQCRYPCGGLAESPSLHRSSSVLRPSTPKIRPSSCSRVHDDCGDSGELVWLPQLWGFLLATHVGVRAGARDLRACIRAVLPAG